MLLLLMLSVDFYHQALSDGKWDASFPSLQLRRTYARPHLSQQSLSELGCRPPAGGLAHSLTTHCATAAAVPAAAAGAGP